MSDPINGLIGAPFNEWSLAEMREKIELVAECQETFGSEAARELMVELGFPVPPLELIDPLPGEQRRH